MSDEWTSERCDRTFHEHFDIMRSRSGTFVETLPDETRKTFGLLCEECYNAVMRRT